MAATIGDINITGAVIVQSIGLDELQNVADDIETFVAQLRTDYSTATITTEMNVTVPVDVG